MDKLNSRVWIKRCQRIFDIFSLADFLCGCVHRVVLLLHKWRCGRPSHGGGLVGSPESGTAAIQSDHFQSDQKLTYLEKPPSGNGASCVKKSSKLGWDWSGRSVHRPDQSKPVAAKILGIKSCKQPILEWQSWQVHLIPQLSIWEIWLWFLTECCRRENCLSDSLFARKCFRFKKQWPVISIRADQAKV